MSVQTISDPLTVIVGGLSENQTGFFVTFREVLGGPHPRYLDPQEIRHLIESGLDPADKLGQEVDPLLQRVIITICRDPGFEHIRQIYRGMVRTAFRIDDRFAHCTKAYAERVIELIAAESRRPLDIYLVQKDVPPETLDALEHFTKQFHRVTIVKNLAELDRPLTQKK